MSNSLIKELTHKTKKNEIVWFKRVNDERRFIGYYMRLDANDLLITQIYNLVWNTYLVQHDGEVLECGRREGKKLYNAIEQSRTDVLEG